MSAARCNRCGLTDATVIHIGMRFGKEHGNLHTTPEECIERLLERHATNAANWAALRADVEELEDEHNMCVSRRQVLELIDRTNVGVHPDTARVDALDKFASIAENNSMVRVWAVSAHREWTLRETLDALRNKLKEKPERKP